MENKDIDFVARHYRKGHFGVNAGWKRLGVAPASTWKRYRAAAAVAATIVLTATAAIIYQEYRTDDVDVPQLPVEVSEISPLAQVKIIDFENASLSEVVKKIKDIYNVEVDNLPENVDEYQLSLHYVGTPTDLINTINDILGTQMTVTEK